MLQNLFMWDTYGSVKNIKRMGGFLGHKVIEELSRMGLIITELLKAGVRCILMKAMKENIQRKRLFTVSELEENLSNRQRKIRKVIKITKMRALEATLQLQQGRRGYQGFMETYYGRFLLMT